MSSDFAQFRHLWIVGLRRSGTTVVWRMFRGLDDFTCYDEPLNPKLVTHLPEQHRKGTWDEFNYLWENDHDAFIGKLATIGLVDEMTAQISARELEYLHYLAQNPTIIDFTRLNLKMRAVLPNFADTAALYLFRSPIAFSTSHLINSENWNFLRQRYYRTMFFSSRIGFDSWGLETNFRSPGFVEMMEDCDITPRKPLRALKSVEKLLLFWLTARRCSQKTVDRDEAGRTFIASYEDIIDGNSDGLAQAIGALGIDHDNLETKHFRPYSLGWRHDDPVWLDLARNAGFCEDEIQIYIRRKKI